MPRFRLTLLEHVPRKMFDIRHVGSSSREKRCCLRHEPSRIRVEASLIVNTGFTRFSLC